METKAAQATNNTGLLDILEQVHAFSIQNDDFESMKSNCTTVLILIFIIRDLRSVRKLLRHCTQIGSLQRTKQSTPLPPPLAPFKVGVFVVFCR